MYWMNANWPPKEGTSHTNVYPKRGSSRRDSLETKSQRDILPQLVNIKCLQLSSIIKIVEYKYKIQHILPIVLEVDAKVYHNNHWRTYHDRNSLLENQCGQPLYIIKVQYMQVILYKMKHDPDWVNTSESCDPLNLLKLI